MFSGTLHHNDIRKRNPYQSKSRRRRPKLTPRRFLLRYAIHHICQRKWRQYTRKCTCVSDVWIVKNKIQNSSNCNWQHILCT